MTRKDKAIKFLDMVNNEITKGSWCINTLGRIIPAVLYCKGPVEGEDRLRFHEIGLHNVKSTGSMIYGADYCKSTLRVMGDPKRYFKLMREKMAEIAEYREQLEQARGRK